MIVYPVVSSVNRARIAVSKTLGGAVALAGAVNERAGNPVLVYPGEPVDVDWQRGLLRLDGVLMPVNPPMGGKSDPHKWILDKLVENANAPRASARKSTATSAVKATPVKATAAKATAAKATPAKATPVKATAAKATPVKATAAKATAAKAGTRTRRTPVKAGAAA